MADPIDLGEVTLSSTSGFSAPSKVRVTHVANRVFLKLPSSKVRTTHVSVKVLGKLPNSKVRLTHESLAVLVRVVPITEASELGGFINAGSVVTGDLSVASTPRETAIHAKISFVPDAGPRRLTQAHTKTAIESDGHPTKVAAESAIVAIQGPGGLDVAQAHAKSAIEIDPDQRNTAEHLKSAIIDESSVKESATHLKVLADIPSTYTIVASHTKVAVTGAMKRKIGWGVLL